MGVTIYNHKHSIDLGYGGYYNLRKTIARLLCPELGKLYEELLGSPLSRGKDYWDEYNERVNAVCAEKDLDPYVVAFLYRSDCSTKSLPPTACRHLWKVIKDYDDDILYGYCARKDCAKFKDFKQIVYECAKERRVMRFS